MIRILTLFKIVAASTSYNLSEYRVCMTAEESARAFAALSNDARDKKISEVVIFLKSESDESTGSPRDFGTALLESGYFDEFMSLTDREFYKVWEMFDNRAGCGIDLDAIFELINLSDDVLPIRLQLYWGAGRYDVESLFGFVFGRDFKDLGSENFRNSIYQYLLKYNQFSRPQYFKDYIPFAALVLKDIYGEERVIEILNRVVSESLISSLGFIRLIKSDQDFRKVPLAWATEMVSND